MSTISSSTTSTTAYKVTADTTGTLVLQTGATPTTAVTIDTSQNVGIGVTPSTWTSTKAIEVGSLGTALWSSGAGSTTLSNGAYYNSGWKYANATSKPSILDFDNAGKITYYVATTTSTAGSAISLTQLLAVEAGKSLALQGATTQTGTGITFPATQSASSDVNTLDDYEEGTWTPTLLIGGSSTGMTQSSSVASYVKVGNMVTCEFQISLSNKGSSGGAVTLVLPFTHKNQNDLYGNCFLYACSLAGDCRTTSLQLNSNSASVTFLKGLGSTAADSGLAGGDCTNTSTFRSSFSYIAN